VSRLHVAVQLLPPPHHGPAGHVDSLEGDALELAERLAHVLHDAQLDGTLANGGCLSITVQHVKPRPAGS
jgi:hypothetical protein